MRDLSSSLLPRCARGEEQISQLFDNLLTDRRCNGNTMDTTSNLSSLIWASADDVLRGLFKPSEYGRVILPFVVMRRLDCVLEPKKDEIYELFTKYKDQISDPYPVISRQIGSSFFNTSKFDLNRIKSDPTNVQMNFNNYVQGYSQNVLDIIENFSFNKLV